MTNRDYLKNKINYILVKNSSIKTLERKSETGLFTWNSEEKLRDNSNKKLISIFATPTGAVTAVGILAGIAGMVFVGGATFTGNQAHVEMGAKTFQAAENILKVGLISDVIPLSIFGFSICNSWYKKIYNNRVEKKEKAIRMQNLVNMMTGTRSRERANKDTESYKIAISLYREVDLTKMRKNILFELLSSLAALKEQEDLLVEGQTREEDVTVARNKFFQSYYRILGTKDCPQDLATNRTIHSIIRSYGEREKQEENKREQYIAQGNYQNIINIARAKRILELRENSNLAPSIIDQGDRQVVGGNTFHQR